MNSTLRFAIAAGAVASVTALGAPAASAAPAAPQAVSAEATLAKPKQHCRTDIRPKPCISYSKGKFTPAVDNARNAVQAKGRLGLMFVAKKRYPNGQIFKEVWLSGTLTVPKGGFRSAPKSIKCPKGTRHVQAMWQKSGSKARQLSPPLNCKGKRV